MCQSATTLTDPALKEYFLEHFYNLQPSLGLQHYDHLIFTCKEVGHKQVRLALGCAPRSSGHRSCRSLAELPYCAISTDMQVPAGQRRLTCWSSHAAFWNVFSVPDNSAGTKYNHTTFTRVNKSFR